MNGREMCGAGLDAGYFTLSCVTQDIRTPVSNKQPLVACPNQPTTASRAANRIDGKGGAS
ncbi:hypothetical protein RvVAR031_05280 [Agrobacterium vitis]|nr:hypothetical protein RvVAR031_05280 [Agrobacterium vitis]